MRPILIAVALLAGLAATVGLARRQRRTMQPYATREGAEFARLMSLP